MHFEIDVIRTEDPDHDHVQVRFVSGIFEGVDYAGMTWSIPTPNTRAEHEEDLAHRVTRPLLALAFGDDVEMLFFSQSDAHPN